MRWDELFFSVTGFLGLILGLVFGDTVITIGLPIAYSVSDRIYGKLSGCNRWYK
jgi:hypothetical protein